MTELPLETGSKSDPRARQEVIRRIRGELTNLVEISAVQSLPAAELTVLKDTVNALDDPFLIVVVGEFNSGKSTMINALLGREAMAEGITPTTSMVHLIRYGETPSRRQAADWGELVTVPSEPLRTMSIVDTPGTNSVFTDHEILTKRFYPRADLVFFVASADRPYSESERRFLESIRGWGKKIVVLINKIDLFPAEADRDRLVSFVRDRVHHDFRLTLPVFAISARAAKEAALKGEAFPPESGFGELTAFLTGTLSGAERFRLKMDSAIRLGERFAKTLQKRTAAEIEIFREDLALIDSIEAMADGYERDFGKEIQRSLREVGFIFDEIRRGADDYFEELFKLRNVPTIVRKEKIRNEFQDRVLKNLPVAVERLASDVVGEIYQRQSTVAAMISERIARRDEPGASLGADSETLSERGTVLKRVQEAIDALSDRLDREVAVEIGMRHVQTAVKTALAIEVSAVGVGAALTIVATTVATDLLGIFAAVWVAVAGFAVLPYYKRKSQHEFQRRLAEVETALTASLEKSLRDEVAGLTGRMKSVVRPLREFDQAKVSLKSDQLARIVSAASALEKLRDASIDAV